MVFFLFVFVRHKMNKTSQYLIGKWMLLQLLRELHYLRTLSRAHSHFIWWYIIGIKGNYSNGGDASLPLSSSLHPFPHPTPHSIPPLIPLSPDLCADSSLSLALQGAPILPAIFKHLSHDWAWPGYVGHGRGQIIMRMVVCASGSATVFAFGPQVSTEPEHMDQVQCISSWSHFLKKGSRASYDTVEWAPRM